MNKYVVFKRTALLMLMFLMAWCLPMKGQDVNIYQLTNMHGNQYWDTRAEQHYGHLSFYVNNEDETL